MLYALRPSGKNEYELLAGDCYLQGLMERQLNHDEPAKI